jgi:hypothetical protein
MTPTFANVPALVITWLRLQSALSGVTIAAAVPSARKTGDGPLVVVRRSGGVAERPLLDRPRLDFLCWHDTEYDASGLAADIRSLLLYDLPGQVLSGHTIYKPSEFSGPALYPDPAGSNAPIVMLTMEIPVRVL